MSEKHKAFFASSFAEDYRWIREAVAAACRELRIEFRPVDEMVMPGTNIVPAIHHEIAQATLAVAVISGLNPNVMYELGLLHSLSKPTVILADKQTLESLPFDLRTLFVVRYDSDAKNQDQLKIVVIAAISRVFSIIEDPAVRTQIATGSFEIVNVPVFDTAQLNIGQMDFEAIKERAVKSVGRKNCATQNISEHDDGNVQGWKLKARCPGGTKVTVVIDINGDIREVDVRD